MLAISKEFREKLNADERQYLIDLYVTLSDNTSLHITQDDVWDGGLTFSEATSSSNSFDIGSAVIGKCTIQLNNIYETYSQYDFFNAKITAYVGLDIEGTPEMIKKGVYTVDDTKYNGSLITLDCLDNMWMFDESSLTDATITTGMTCGSIVAEACRVAGVGLASANFPNYNYVPNVVPTEKMNLREVISYIAQICCCYCKINTNGNLVLDWYDKELVASKSEYDGGSYKTLTTPYSDGCDLDGGTFAYNDGDYADGGTFNDLNQLVYFTNNKSISVGTDIITITGVRVKNEDSENGYNVLYGNDTYALVINKNPFITSSNCNTIATYIGSNIVGFKLRTFNCQTLSNPAIESGDACLVTDHKGNAFYSYITEITFQTGNYQKASCGAETPKNIKSVRYSESVKTAVEQARKNAVSQIGIYDQSVQRMNELATNAMGLRWLEVDDGQGGTIYYMSNKPLSLDDDGKAVFTQHSKVWKNTASGFFVCSDAGVSDSASTWTAGWDSDNNVVVNTLSTVGINFDWAYGGTLTLGGQNNKNGILEVYDENNVLSGKWEKNSISIFSNREYDSESAYILYESSCSINPKASPTWTAGSGETNCGIVFESHMKYDFPDESQNVEHSFGHIISGTGNALTLEPRNNYLSPTEREQRGLGKRNGELSIYGRVYTHIPPCECKSYYQPFPIGSNYWSFNSAVIGGYGFTGALKLVYRGTNGDDTHHTFYFANGMLIDLGIPSDFSIIQE